MTAIVSRKPAKKNKAGYIQGDRHLHRFDANGYWKRRSNAASCDEYCEGFIKSVSL
jgi:hypothetical protein